MASKPEDKREDLPQEEPQGILFEFTADTGGTIRSAGTASYEVIPTYRAGVYAEQAKIGWKDTTRQLLLGEGAGLLDIDKKVSEYMPSFTYTELRAYSAIQRFIDEQYKAGDLLEVSFSPQEFYDYCGLQKNPKGSYSRKQQEEYKEALKGLAKKDRKIIQQRSEFTKNKKGKRAKKIYTYILTAPLITLLEGDVIESDTKEEAQEVLDKAISGQELPQRKRRTRYVVRPEKIMYELLDSFYVRKSISQYEEIRALHPGDKPKESTQAFLDFIQLLDYGPLKIGRDTLADRMNLHTYIKQRKRTLINSRINEALEDALKARYILSYKEEPTGLLIIQLNPERCSRYAEKLARTKRKEEEKA